MCVARPSHLPYYLFFFFNDTATTEIYTLSLHDALPISPSTRLGDTLLRQVGLPGRTTPKASTTSGCAIRQRARILKKLDRKSTRLNSSHANISYAVFCLKKKKQNTIQPIKIISIYSYT